jgi:hypothetical protein
MDLLNSPENSIKIGEPLRLKLKCRANKDCNNMRLRFEIIASDNTIAGTTFSSNYINAHKGEVQSFMLNIDTSNFVPGNYRFDLLAFDQNDFGIQDFVDRIEGAAQIELASNETDLIWLPQWWGHTHFNDFLITKVIS